MSIQKLLSSGYHLSPPTELDDTPLLLIRVFNTSVAGRYYRVDFFLYYSKIVWHVVIYLNVARGKRFVYTGPSAFKTARINLEHTYDMEIYLNYFEAVWADFEKGLENDRQTG
jgi:hypothetical protein